MDLAKRFKNTNEHLTRTVWEGHNSIVSEYAGMSGKQYIKTKDELSSILEIGEQMIDAMIHMHNEMQLAYFDWNLDNLGVTEVSGKPFVKVFDYDRCRNLDDNMRQRDVQAFWGFMRRYRHTHGLGRPITEAIEQYWNRETL